MPKAYFISDAHLGLGSKEEERAKERRLIAFLDFAFRDAGEIFIVGDLFDAWFEYRTVIPKGYHRLLTKLEEGVEHGVTIHYLAGNHDYWMGSFFRDELGIRTYYHPFEAIIDGKRFYIHHGDGLANNDTGYRILKRILRSPVNIGLYKMLHPDLGINLARLSSKKSRHYTSQKDYGDEDGMITTATRKIKEGYDVVIMGHRHRPLFKQIGPGVYVNLGDWISHNTYAEASNGAISLHSWEK